MLPSICIISYCVVTAVSAITPHSGHLPIKSDLKSFFCLALLQSLLFPSLHNPKDPVDYPEQIIVFFTCLIVVAVSPARQQHPHKTAHRSLQLLWQNPLQANLAVDNLWATLRFLYLIHIIRNPFLSAFRPIYLHIPYIHQ